jgi:type IV pilus assembly protein PilF
VTNIGKQIIIFLVILFTLPSCVPYSDDKKPIVSPHSSSALKNARIGLNYLHYGYTDKAYTSLQLALRQAPENPLILDAMAYYYEKTGEIITANRYYRAALEASPESGTALNNYGAFLCRNGKYEASLIYFEQAEDLLSKTKAREARANKRFCKQKMQLALGSRDS